MHQVPYSGVSILIKGTDTDFDGNYSVKAKTRDVLVFRYLGYKVVNKTIGNSNVINIKLQEDVNILDEIIITGQGSGIQKRKLSTTVDVLNSD
ncbi:hypothetical protein CW731_14750 [Polaribacter sp. ALD11]|uniref:carboxypeptidase-like regulatory domain-containing protein n=1 Tax=Polaribacter sp. ALD11 TaxID=2058137 RepID=UPI000C30606A|nr:carboxypeptidase-like regulatory domain-containing protein [Polaribacter sp. ALD11]AUC86461.1 hypothetical protein CW731_14750 [Polaribacter sp. ALD11]